MYIVARLLALARACTDIGDPRTWTWTWARTCTWCNISQYCINIMIVNWMYRTTWIRFAGTATAILLLHVYTYVGQEGARACQYYCSTNTMLCGDIHCTSWCTLYLLIRDFAIWYLVFGIRVGKSECWIWIYEYGSIEYMYGTIECRVVYATPLRIPQLYRLT